MIRPVPLVLLPGGLFSLCQALAKLWYIYELSLPPYWSAPSLADARHISLYRMTYVIAAACSERLPFSMYILFSKYLIQYNKVYSIWLRLDYGGLGLFCSTHANMEFFSHISIYK